MVSIANRCGLRRSLSDDPIGVGCARRPGGTGPCNCRPKLSQASPRTRLLQVRFGRPGRALNRPTWSPVNSSSARVSTIRSATVVRQRFFGIPATDADIISAQHFWTGGLETAGPGCYDAVAIARAAGFRMLVMSRIRHAAIVP